MSDQIEVLPGCMHIRKRPEMYLGSTDSQGILYLFQELLNRAIEVSKEKIGVVFYIDGTIAISDDGPGFPVGKHSRVDKTILELVMTELGTGPSSIGCLPVVNALSEYLVVETTPVDSLNRYSIQFARCSVVAPMSEQPAADVLGTKITFRPDKQIFGEAKIDTDQAQTLINATLKSTKLKLCLDFKDS